MSSSSSTSSDSSDYPPRLYPNYTRALWVSIALQAIGSWSCVLTTRKWETAPLWVNLMFWPASISTIILGAMHMRDLISDWRDAMRWILFTLAVIAFALLYRQVALYYLGEPE
ncbi:hypothetical protein N7474_006047 [Penicillium riverlandense]|uniref:uncharacterized protein n=1 Tax=Penicillium riverlandense TaxID=1903569 RepID=UPI0025477EC1|nr:uncharacterized protein N7474_006047 [Penicillium riverlandense]KAJ5820456.1 hypothetical protein N7474_006047 [Penicillium riverlandense]